MSDKDPFAEGADARLAGRPDTANPYEVDGPDGDFEAHCAWNDGWASIDEE